MQDDHETKSAIGKGYLLLLLAALLWLPFSPLGKGLTRHLFRSERRTGNRSGNQTTGRASSTAPAAANLQRDMEHARQDLEVFGKWLMDETVTPLAVVRKIDRAEGTDTPVSPFALWVPNIATFQTDGVWQALWRSRTLMPGDVINVESGKMGYQILSISHRCVWLAAFCDAVPAGRLWTLDWSDIKGVRLSAGSAPQPDRVELRRGVFASKGDRLVFENPAVGMQVGRLWFNAVHFIYRSGENAEPIDLLCVVLR
jgi:hypothetical protein